MSEEIELMMRQVKLGGMAKEWRSVQFESTEQYVTDLLKLELKEREANRINRMGDPRIICVKVNKRLPLRRELEYEIYV